MPRTLAEIAVWVKYGVVEVEVGGERRTVRVGGEEYVLAEHEITAGKWRNRQTGEEGEVKLDDEGDEVTASGLENAAVRSRAVDCIIMHERTRVGSAAMLKVAFINVLTLLKKAKTMEDRILGKGLKGIAKRLEEERVRVLVREGNRREVEGRKSRGGSLVDGGQGGENQVWDESRVDDDNGFAAATTDGPQTQEGRRSLKKTEMKVRLRH